MFENLSGKLQDVFSSLKSKGRLSEKDIDAAMREIRLALLEADVNFKVVKRFVNATKERCLEADVLESLTPAQNVIKIVLEEMTKLLGGQASQMVRSPRMPNVIMLVGLQGSGKTTAAAKLAFLQKKQSHMPELVACDIYRPAAIDQLKTLGSEIDVRVYSEDSKDAVEIAKHGLRDAIDNLRDTVIVDTAGRLHIDEEMMDEIVRIKKEIKPDTILFVLDAMAGQDAVTAAAAFAERIDYDGVIISKMDGDARGGAALSVSEMLGKPILFTSAGEKPSSLEPFYPDRMAKRILGMGDVVSLIEKAVDVAEEKEAAAQAERMLKNEFTFDDFLDTIKKIRKMGGVASLVSSLPGGDKMAANGQVDESAVDRTEAIIFSMTKEERRKPSIINGQRRARIAKGAGVEVQDVNQVIARFNEMKKMMKKMMGDTNTKHGRRKLNKMLGGMGDLSQFM